MNNRLSGFIWNHSPGLRWLSNRLGGNSGAPTNYPISQVAPLTQDPIAGSPSNFSGYGSPPVNQLAGGAYDPSTGGPYQVQHVPLNTAGNGRSPNDFQMQGIGPPRIGPPSGYQGGGSSTLGAVGQVDPSQWGQLVSMAYDTRNRIGNTNSTFRGT